MKTVTRLNVVALLCILALIMSIVAIATSGPQGLQGEPGPSGVQGVPGATGTGGAAGAAGPQGPQGLVGSQGLIGLTGDKGDKGDLSDRTLEVSRLATLSVSDVVVHRGGTVYVYGAAIFSDLSLYLLDSLGTWFTLGPAIRNVANNTIGLNVTIPSNAVVGVAELSTRLPGSEVTYQVMPILIQY